MSLSHCEIRAVREICSTSEDAEVMVWEWLHSKYRSWLLRKWVGRWTSSSCGKPVSCFWPFKLVFNTIVCFIFWTGRIRFKVANSFHSMQCGDYRHGAESTQRRISFWKKRFVQGDGFFTWSFFNSSFIPVKANQQNLGICDAFLACVHRFI